MKKRFKYALLICVGLALCICVGVCVYLRMSWCHVTFVCEEGCVHKTWCRTGEKADTSVVVQAHEEERKNLQIAGIYKDEERLINYLDEPLTSGKTTLYVGEWKRFDMLKLHCFTPYGTIVLFYDADDIYNSLTPNLIQHRFIRAFAALGAPNTDDMLAYQFVYVINETQYISSLNALSHAIVSTFGLSNGGMPCTITFPYVNVVPRNS